MYLPYFHLWPSNLAGVDFCIEYLVFSLALPPRSHNMPWQAKPGCPEHHRAAVERTVNLLPPAWLLTPQSGEIFNSLDHCDRRLRGFSFAKGFDIVRKGGGTKANLT
jgi:hypothetical protein